MDSGSGAGARGYGHVRSLPSRVRRVSRRVAARSGGLLGRWVSSRRKSHCCRASNLDLERFSPPPEHPKDVDASSAAGGWKAKRASRSFSAALAAPEGGLTHRTLRGPHHRARRWGRRSRTTSCEHYGLERTRRSGGVGRTERRQWLPPTVSAKMLVCTRCAREIPARVRRRSNGLRHRRGSRRRG
jgi:hypothetical protein